MAIYREDIVDIDLAKEQLHRSFLSRSIGKADNKANRFGVRVFRNGVLESLNGISVQGYFRDPLGNNIAITSGNSATGSNPAYVSLPQACYNYEGQFTLAIKLVGGNVTGTVRIVDGMVDNTNTGGAVAPTETVPTYQEVLSVFEQMEQAVEDTEDFLNYSVANEFSDTKTYDVGDYVIYEGKLYRCSVEVSTEGEWTGNTNWTQCTAMGQMNGLRSGVAAAYDASVTYSKGDYVSYNRYFWRSKVDDNTDHEPTNGSYWQRVDISNDLKERFTATDNAIVEYGEVINPDTYEEHLSDANDAQINTIYRMVFNVGDTEIPSHLPYDTWKATIPVLFIDIVSKGTTSNRVQYFIDEDGLFERSYTSQWWAWKKINDLSRIKEIIGFDNPNIWAGFNRFSITQWFYENAIPNTPLADNEYNVYFDNSVMTPYVFSDTDIPVTITADITIVGGSNQRFELLNSNGDIVATVTEAVGSATGIGCKIRGWYGSKGYAKVKNAAVIDHNTTVKELNNAIVEYGTEINPVTYSTHLPDANSAQINRIYRITFDVDDSNIPAHLPYATWKATIPALLVDIVTKGTTHNRLQYFVDDSGIYQRSYTSQWWSWTHLNDISADVYAAVEGWLNDHPEVTTTVEDHSLSYVKLINGTLGFVTPEMYGAAGDGVTDDTDCLQQAFETGLEVVLNGSYAVSDKLTYAGHRITGKGTLKAIGNTNSAPRLIECSGTSLTVEGITINCGGVFAMGMFITCTGNVSVRGVTVYNTDNGSNSYGCSGIFVNGCRDAEITECYVHDIQRTTTNQYVISSTGIVVYSSGMIRIANCRIANISCRNELTDCDAIYVAKQNGADYVTAIIENNKLSDSTGRMIKIQTDTTTIIGNTIMMSGTTFNTSGFKIIDVQKGDCCVMNNRIELGEAYNRYVYIFCMSHYSDEKRAFTAIGNVVNGDLPQLVQDVVTVRAIFAIEATATGEINAQITNNQFNIASQTTLYISRPTAMNNKITFEDNVIHTYQAVEPITITHFKDTYVIYQNNKQTSPYTSGNSRLCPDACTFSNLIFKNNDGLDQKIDCYPVSYEELGIFEGYYRGYFGGMQDLPESISGDGTDLYLKKGAEMTWWAYPQSGTSGVC